MKTQIIGYHFTGDKLRDGRPLPKIGEWLQHEGAIEVCKSGIHASEHPMDAMQYAPGPFLHRVVLKGELVPHGDPTDKWCGRHRQITATINSERLMRDFARWCALRVVHLWDAPEIVVRYLKTGDETIRAAARDAARDAAMDAAWDAAMDAAWDAARDAAWAAAWDAARAAAWAAARDAARAAARDAARAAARDAAWNAAWNAARDAALDDQRTKFKELVDAAFDDHKGAA